MFSYRTQIRLAHTDAARKLYFAALFDLAHEAFESFLDGGGQSIQHMIEEGDFIAPVVHAEADYLTPMTLGSAFGIELTCHSIGASSFSIAYAFVDDEGEVAATARLVHAVVLKESKEAVAVPPGLKSLLDSIAG
ncbi:MAG: acyl-CoA thioesterase [Verrucomicrobia bacterium]|nr:acyl-CoA thioesterase [Verrucomicrobiota bacterium]